MRAIVAALLASFCVFASAASPAARPLADTAGLRSIAGWLKARGTPGYLGADVADAIGIPRGDAKRLDAMQRGFRDAEVLRIAQVFEGGYLLFVVQSEGEVYFYLSTLAGGLRKALVSVPSRDYVVPVGAAEAKSNFGREVLFWEDKAAR